MGVMATRRIPPQTAVVWEQLRSYGAFAVTMVIVGLAGALALLVNYRLETVSFRDVLTIYDGYRALVFIAMALLLSISHNPDNARMAFPLRLFRLPLPTETLAALVLGSRLLLLSLAWAFLLLFRIVLMEAPERLGIELFYLCLGLAWYTGFQSGTWFAAGRNVWLWGAWVVPLGAVAVMITQNRSIQGGHFDAPEGCGHLLAALGILALQAIRAVRFHRCRSLDEEKVGFLDVLRPQHRLRRAQGALVFENPLDAQAWFLRRRYHQGRKWVFALAALAVVACKLYTYSEYANPVITLLMLLFPAGCVFLLALYWQVADAYLGRSGGMTFTLVRPFSSTDCARARLLVASRQVLWDLCLVVGLPLLAMWVAPPRPTLLYYTSWPVVLAGFHEQFGMSALRAAGVLVLAAWILRALPPDAAAKAAAAVFGPVILVALLAVYNLLEWAEKGNVWLMTMCVVGLLLILLFLHTFRSAWRLGLIPRWVAGLSVVAALALAGFYYLDVAELLNGAPVLDVDDQHWRLWKSTKTSVNLERPERVAGMAPANWRLWNSVKTSVNPWLANALFLAGLGGLAALPFAAGPLQWRRWRHGAGKDAPGSLSPAGGEGAAEFLRRFLPAPLGLAGVLAVLWIAGAWYHVHRDDYLPRVSGERRSLESLMAEAARVPDADNASPVYRRIVSAADTDLRGRGVPLGGVESPSLPRPPVDVKATPLLDTLIGNANRLLCGADCPDPLEPGGAERVDAAMRALGPRLDELVEATALPKATGSWMRVQDSYGSYQHFDTTPEYWACSLLSIEGRLACGRGDLPRAVRMLEGLLNLAAQNPENYAWGKADLRARCFSEARSVLTCLLSGNLLDTETLRRLDAAWERAFAAPHRAGRVFRALYEARTFNLPFDARFRGYYRYDLSGLTNRPPDLLERCLAPWYCLSGTAAHQRWIAAWSTNWWVEHTRKPELWGALGADLSGLWRTLSPTDRADYDLWYGYTEVGSGYYSIAKGVLLARTAIRLRLFHQQWGRLPDTLEGLLPEARPPDFRVANKKYCGGELRYVRVGDGCVLDTPTVSDQYSDEYPYYWGRWMRGGGRLIIQPEPWQAARQ